MQKYSLSKGFTLIELLVVIAILGILAAVVLVAINPAQRIAEANDTKVKSSISSVATAVEACYTQQATGYYSGCASDSALTTGGFLKTTPNPSVSYVLKTSAGGNGPNSEIHIVGQLTAVSSRPSGCSTSPYIFYDSTNGSTTVQCANPGAF